MEKRRKKSRNFKWTAGLGTIFVVILFISFMQLGDNSVFFLTPKEAVLKAKTLSNQTIKVGGMVKPNSVEWIPESLSLKFIISNLKGTEIAVAHTGTPPDMFKEGQGVIVEGQIASNGQSMLSKGLMVKHSEEYQKPDAHHSLEPELLKKSIFKDQKY